MNYNKKDKNWIYHLIIAVLVVILIVVSFCMLSIHVPYFNHENDIALERNKLREMYDELENLLESFDRGLEAIENGKREIENGIDAISEVV